MADPIRPEVRELMNDIGRVIGDALPPGYGFVLLTFELNKEGHMNYISNGQREDVVKALYEFLDNVKRDSNG